MSAVGTAVFDAALVAYPLYETCALVVSPAINGDAANVNALVKSEADSRRLMRFWFVYGGLNVSERFGADGIPGYHLAKGALLIAMYSDVHSELINSAVLQRACQQYLNLANRIKAWWSSNAVPQIASIDKQSGGWLKSSAETVGGWMGLGSWFS